MRLVFTVLSFALCVLSSLAQIPVTDPSLEGLYGDDELYDPNNPFADDEYDNDTTPKIDAESIPVHVEMWKLDSELGFRSQADVDTLLPYYYNTCLTEGLRNEYNYLGNLGSPRYGRYFPLQDEGREFIFLNPYGGFVKSEQDVMFVDTKSPYANLDYYKGGSKHSGEERFKTYFGVSVNRKFSFGFNVDYIYGRGYYQKQSTSHINGGAFAAYNGDKYDLSFAFGYFRMKTRENGGISDDRYITNPLSMNEGKNQYSSSDIPVVFNDVNVWNADAVPTSVRQRED